MEQIDINGIKTATYTCSNGGSGSPLTGTTSGSRSLTGTSNITYTVTCTDEAGNSTTSSHTYKYSSCASGSNTCSPGYVYGQWGSYGGCTLPPSQAFSDNTTECRLCGEDLYQCRTRTQSYSNCASGSNTCASGFKLNEVQAYNIK